MRDVRGGVDRVVQSDIRPGTVVITSSATSDDDYTVTSFRNVLAVLSEQIGVSSKPFW